MPRAKRPMEVERSARLNRERKGKPDCGRREWDEYDEKAAREGDSLAFTHFVSTPTWRYPDVVETWPMWYRMDKGCGFG